MTRDEMALQRAEWDRQDAEKASPTEQPKGAGQSSGWTWTESGTDTDGDPKQMQGELGDYVVTLTMSRTDGTVSARTSIGDGKMGFPTFNDAQAYGVRVVEEHLSQRVTAARKTIALYATTDNADGLSADRERDLKLIGTLVGQYAANAEFDAWQRLLAAPAGQDLAAVDLVHARGLIDRFDKAYGSQAENETDAKLMVLANYGEAALNTLRAALKDRA